MSETALRAFVEDLAKLTRQGDVVKSGLYGLEVYEYNNEDAGALYMLIDRARELTGAWPGTVAKPEEVDQCSQCERWFKVGDPHFAGEDCDEEDDPLAE